MKIKDYIERLQKYFKPEDECTVIGLYIRADLEDLHEIKLTDEQWSAIVDIIDNSDYLAQAISEAVSEIIQEVTHD
jgi:hypothetical protein